MLLSISVVSVISVANRKVKKQACPERSRMEPMETARIQNTEARRQKNRLRGCDTRLKKQSQFSNARISVNVLQGKDYGDMPWSRGRKNKANSSATEGTEGTERGSKSLLISWYVTQYLCGLCDLCGQQKSEKTKPIPKWSKLGGRNDVGGLAVGGLDKKRGIAIIERVRLDKLMKMR